MGAPEGNTNARGGRRRVDSHLSIGNSRHGPKRLNWVLAQLQKQGMEDPTDRQVARFVIDFCYAKIDEQIRQHSGGTAASSQ